MKRIMSVFLAALIAAASALACPAYVYADSTPYVALGADLTDEQRSIVLSLLSVTEEELKSDTVITVTNAEEHQYLDSYLDASVIGTRALSSCKVTAEPAGHGITVEAHNISYLTPSMYVNALATAGMKDASVVVAGPTQISGTAALVGAMKAYAAMTGTTISEKALDGANDELVATGELAQTIGDAEKASELIAAGVDRDALLQQLYNSYRENRVRLFGHMQANELRILGEAACMILTKDLQQRFDVREGETEGLVNVPLTIADVRLSIFLKEDDGHFRVSIRSKKGTSAQQLAVNYFHGGGHENAAGGKLFIGEDIPRPEDAAAYVESALKSFLQ